MNKKKNSANKPLLLLFTGAGFSAHAGAPVMEDFLDVAEKTLSDDILRRIGAGFYFTGYAMETKPEPAMPYWSSMQTSMLIRAITKPNLETAYGAMVFRKALHCEHFKVATVVRGQFMNSRNGTTVGESIEGFEQAIPIVYGRLVNEHFEQWIDHYSQFFRYILERFKLGIVTTNYDLVIERALNEIHVDTSYVCRDNRSSEDTLPILKLHGSVNWPKQDDLCLETLSTQTEPEDKAWVLPPTWNKDIEEKTFIRKVWKEAVELVRRANLVLVIGHSFSSTDSHLHYLFAEALLYQNKEQTKQARIVDQDLSTAERVRDTFAKFQTTKGENSRSLAMSFTGFLDALGKGSISL